MEQTITVLGHSSIARTPDQITLHFTLNNKDMKYDKIVDKADKDLTKLQSAMKETGIDPTLLKTNHVNIYPGTGSLFQICSYQHSLSLKVDYAPDVINRILSSITNLGSTPEMSFSFSVKDEEEAMDALLTEAVENAHSRALILAKAAGQSLGKISHMQYGNDTSFYPSSSLHMGEGHFLRKARLADINPDDVSLSAQVSVTWSLL